MCYRMYQRTRVWSRTGQPWLILLLYTQFTTVVRCRIGFDALLVVYGTCSSLWSVCARSTLTETWRDGGVCRTCCCVRCRSASEQTCGLHEACGSEESNAVRRPHCVADPGKWRCTDLASPGMRPPGWVTYVDTYRGTRRNAATEISTRRSTCMSCAASEGGTRARGTYCPCDLPWPRREGKSAVPDGDASAPVRDLVMHLKPSPYLMLV